MAVYSLDEWRAVVRGSLPAPTPDYPVITFPSDELRAAYLKKASAWPENEVRDTLRIMLGQSRNIPEWDDLQLQIIKSARLSSDSGGNGDHQSFSEYERRLILRAHGKSSEPTWPGLTWVLDLLPRDPRQAISATSAYFDVHWQVMPDMRVTGLLDAMAIMRHRYIMEGETELDAKVSLLRSINPHDIEYLAAALYARKGYKVNVTPGQKDGGKDIIAHKNSEIIYIECKNWEQRVDVKEVRAFFGVSSGDPVTRAVMISISGFTEHGPEAALKWAQGPTRRHRIDLVDGRSLAQDLNEHLGTDWAQRLDLIIAYQKKGNIQQMESE
ncbi:restriction endonuclease [Nocardia sp. NPDC058705]|uniref:restriction endonuclease n=1 Tax=Nocardia sp. NPDC058705 TaxID=3346609 RepID=UPI0036C09EEA